MKSGFTPTEKAFLKLLADGRPHTRRELHALLPDDLGALSNIKFHLSSIRKKLPPCQTILCEIVHRRICYRHVKLLSAPCR